MKTKIITIAVLNCWLCSLLLLAGCDIEIGSLYRAKYERMVQCQAPLTPGSTVAVETKAGSIELAGADINDCNVTATIAVRAPSEEEAQEIAEQVQINLVPAGDRLTVKADIPPMKRHRSVSVSYNINVPRKTNVECSSSFGSIKLDSLNGHIKARTSSGSVSSKDIQGTVELGTSFGSITCRNITGELLKAKTSSGAITAEKIQGSAHLETSFGSITCRDACDGDLTLKTSSGSITLSNARFGNCVLRTSFGGVSCDELRGDSVELHSDSGGITATKVSAQTTKMSTSFGRIKCREMTTSNLTARSSSGSLDIACSPTTPPDLTAEATTSFGNIDFVTPPNFAGQVDLATDFGSVKTNLPITIVGELSKKKITGRIQEGTGRLRLKTSSGSINIR